MNINIWGLKVLITLRMVIIFCILSIIGYVLIIIKRKKDDPNESVFLLVVKNQNYYMGLLAAVIWIMITSVAMRIVWLSGNTGTPTIIEVITVVMMFLIGVRVILKKLERLLNINILRHTKTSQKNKAISTMRILGSSCVIFAIVISFMMWKEEQIPYDNYDFINGLITNISKENHTQNITIEYKIENNTYRINENCALHGLYINKSIKLVYNKDDFNQAKIKYGTPTLGYAGLFILFIFGVFILLLSIWTGPMKWKMIRPLQNGAVFEVSEDKDEEVEGNNYTKEKVGLINKIMKPKNPTAAIIFMMSLLFIVFSTIAIWKTYEDSKITIKNPNITNGIVIGLSREYTGNNEYEYYPIVEFKVLDKEYTFISSQWIHDLKKNEAVTVIYNMNDPYQAEISRSQVGAYAFWMIFFCIGIFLFVVSRKMQKSTKE